MTDTHASQPEPGEIRFVVPAVPVAQPRQRHRVATINGKAMSLNYTPSKHPITAFKATCRMAASAAYRGQPLAGPLFVAVTFVFPRPKRLMKKSSSEYRIFHDTRPDFDNCAKGISDALNGLIWQDDKQLCWLEVRKWYAATSEQPHVEVTIRPLADLTGV